MKVQRTIHLLCTGRSHEVEIYIIITDIVLDDEINVIFSLQPSSIKVQIWHSIWGEAVGAAQSQAKSRSNQERLPVVRRAQDIRYHMDETLLLHHKGNTGVSRCEWGEREMGRGEGEGEGGEKREGGGRLLYAPSLCSYFVLFFFSRLQRLNFQSLSTWTFAMLR